MAVKARLEKVLQGELIITIAKYRFNQDLERYGEVRKEIGVRLDEQVIPISTEALVTRGLDGNGLVHIGGIYTGRAFVFLVKFKAISFNNENSTLVCP